MQLHPRESFVITRQLQNPYITDTFYVRAVIRNAKTDTTLDTLNLTDNGSQRFTKTWQVPADPSGQGFWISIITSVYTDSGYTTKSVDYGDEENTYLVQERYVFNPNYPVGPDINYEKIQKMIDNAVKKVLAAEPKVEVVTKEVVKEVKVPDVRVVEVVKNVDFTPLINEIKVVGKKVDDKEVTDIPDLDLSPVMKMIEMIPSLLDKKTKELKSAIDSSVNKNSTRFKKMQTLKKLFDESFEDEEEDDVVEEPKEEEKPTIDPRIIRVMKNK